MVVLVVTNFNGSIDKQVAMISIGFEHTQSFYGSKYLIF
jgi:hypothetical protein